MQLNKTKEQTIDEKKQKTHPFNKDVVLEDEDILIIGTFPAIEKHWNFKFFYSSDKNKLWNILEKIFNTTVIASAEDKIKFLKSKNIGMIDIIEECERIKKENSSDNNLKIIALRDIYSILKNNKTIKRIILTSRSGKNGVLSLLKKELDENYLNKNKIELRFKKFARNMFEFKSIKSDINSKLLRAEIFIKDEQRRIDVFVPYSPSLRCFNRYGEKLITEMYKNSLIIK
jgi:hypoxanthine-DNA glycosylase